MGGETSLKILISIHYGKFLLNENDKLWYKSGVVDKSLVLVESQDAESVFRSVRLWISKRLYVFDNGNNSGCSMRVTWQRFKRFRSAR